MKTMMMLVLVLVVLKLVLLVLVLVVLVLVLVQTVGAGAGTAATVAGTANAAADAYDVDDDDGDADDDDHDDDDNAIETQPILTPDPAFDTATRGVDYVEPTTQVTIGPGLTTASFKVAIENDNMVERGYYSFDGEDDDGDNIIQKDIGESEGMIQLLINCERNDNLELAHSGYVDLHIRNITGKTAIDDVDFDSSGTIPIRVHFTPGSYVVDGTTGKDTALISIDIYNDNLVENTANEMFEVTLVGASGGEIGNGPTKAEITIVDNDALIGLQDTSVTVSESVIEVTAILNRSGDLSGTDTVRLISRSQTATSGTSADNGDYMRINEVLTFNPGDTSATVQITLFDDDQIETSESFILSVVALSTRDLTVDPERDELTVTIEDNDCLFSLEVDEDEVSENNNGAQPSILVTVRRNGFLNKVSSIYLKTSNVGVPVVGRDDATPNTDFINKDEQLVFQPGDTERTTSISILNDNQPELSEVFINCDKNGQQQGDSLSVLATSVDGNRAATPEADYQGGRYTATFEANSGDTSISIPIFDDDFQEQSPETFVVKIDGIVGTDSAAKVISNPDERRTTVCIQDDDGMSCCNPLIYMYMYSYSYYFHYIQRTTEGNKTENKCRKGLSRGQKGPRVVFP
ncbi:extracellular matrix protein 3-like [Amphiura filiformis]|uniref:extracellular matrix protein 3-like n=1 Tax=Amphiura filiformis TaxID=82378 RepID=UPI003B22617E